MLLEDYSEKNTHNQSHPKLRFLCPHHRDWVYFNSQEALASLEQMQLKGEFLLEHHKYQEALPLIGCAWETVEILLELYTGERSTLVTRFGCLTVLLDNCFRSLKQKVCAEHVCKQAVETLKTSVEQLDPTSDAYEYVSQCIAQLQKPELFRFYLMPIPASQRSVAMH
ncbi:hypothetical protein [Planctobacterium marinum]|uniref:hypothetical protein n=1 Tax=Planctobacterium marinum TaxID=1631968 RepID=UPI001E3B999E|nr:hypothetical protein [Planctobacterium marinum]MCC2608208.1 hypothetical protein [Planctobacterium marinum]